MNNKDIIKFYLDEIIKYINNALVSNDKSQLKLAQFYTKWLKEIISSNKCTYLTWKGIRISKLSYEQAMDFLDCLHNEDDVEI